MNTLQSPHRCVVVLEDSLDGALDQGDLIFSHPFLTSCLVMYHKKIPGLADSAALPLPLLPNPQLLGYLCNVHVPVEFPSSLPTSNSTCLLP